MDKKVCTKLCGYLIDIRLDVDDYWDNIKPLVDKALRIIEPSHKLIKRFEKEEKLFDFLKKSRLKEIEEEKENRIAKVKSDINQQVQTRKAKARKDCATKLDLWILGFLGAIIGAIIGAVIGRISGGAAPNNSLLIGNFIVAGAILGAIGGAIGRGVGAIIGVVMGTIIGVEIIPERIIKEGGGEAVRDGLILGVIGGCITYIIIGVIAKNIAAKKVTITPAEEKDRDERMKAIETDIKDKIANLDNEIRKKISKKTKEQIDEISRRIR